MCYYYLLRSYCNEFRLYNLLQKSITGSKLHDIESRQYTHAQ